MDRHWLPRKVLQEHLASQSISETLFVVNCRVTTDSQCQAIVLKCHQQCQTNDTNLSSNWSIECCHLTFNTHQCSINVSASNRNLKMGTGNQVCVLIHHSDRITSALEYVPFSKYVLLPTVIYRCLRYFPRL